MDANHRPKVLTAVRRGRSEGRRDVTRIDLDVLQPPAWAASRATLPALSPCLTIHNFKGHRWLKILPLKTIHRLAMWCHMVVSFLVALIYEIGIGLGKFRSEQEYLR